MIGVSGTYINTMYMASLFVTYKEYYSFKLVQLERGSHCGMKQIRRSLFLIKIAGLLEITNRNKGRQEEMP